MKPIVGIDFDNTIVCYDEIFHKVALEKGIIQSGLPKTKEAVRNYLRKCDKEVDWTKLQGYVYGMRMEEVKPFQGVIEFFNIASQHNIDVYIVSHKTRTPYLGPKYDLHMSARNWLIKNHFFDSDSIGLKEHQVFFELTMEDKLKQIALLNCSHFIDDLPELLTHSLFPSKTKKLLFSPTSISQKKGDELIQFYSWHKINDYFFHFPKK